MDYPHPLVDYENGKFDLSRAYAMGIGDYDKASIIWGYQDFPATVNEKVELEKIVQKNSQISDENEKSPVNDKEKGYISQIAEVLVAAAPLADVVGRIYAPSKEGKYLDAMSSIVSSVMNNSASSAPEKNEAGGKNPVKDPGQNTLREAEQNRFRNPGQNPFREAEQNRFRNPGHNTLREAGQNTLKNLGQNQFGETGQNTLRNLGQHLSREAGKNTPPRISTPSEQSDQGKNSLFSDPAKKTGRSRSKSK
jgi:hypothetical protein